MRNSQSLPPQQAQMQAAQQAQVAAWQAAQRQAQEQAAQQQAAAQAQAQAAAQAQAQQAAEYAAAQAQAQQAAEYAAWQAQQEQAMQQGYYNMGAPASSGRAIGALICGILSILFFPVGVVGLILAIVAVALALTSNKAFGKTGTSKGGLVCGIVGGVLSIIAIAATVFLTITLMQAADNGEFGFNLDAIFSPSSSTGSNRSGVSNDSSFDYSSYLNAGEQQAYDAVSNRLASIQSGDAQTLQEIATAADQSFQQAYGASMQSCGIDPNTYVKSMTENFSYDVDTVVIADTADGRSYVTASLSCRDVSDVKTTFDEALSALNSGTNLASITSDDAKAQISQAFISAVDNARFSAGSVLTVDVTQADGSWTVDQASWNQQIVELFGFA